MWWIASSILSVLSQLFEVQQAVLSQLAVIPSIQLPSADNCYNSALLGVQVMMFPLNLKFLMPVYKQPLVLCNCPRSFFSLRQSELKRPEVQMIQLSNSFIPLLRLWQWLIDLEWHWSILCHIDLDVMHSLVCHQVLSGFISMGSPHCGTCWFILLKRISTGQESLHLYAWKLSSSSSARQAVWTRLWSVWQ